MDLATAARLLTVVCAPAAVAGAVLWLPRGARVLRDLLRRRDPGLRPVGPPLERTAADLRRLMAEHDAVRRSPAMAGRATHLAVLEAALTDCALHAARAVGLDLPADAAGHGPLSREQLRLLLGDLAGAGLFLPAHERFGR
ncbi:MAG: hypothetical protein JWN55_1722 [Frankiales bacterium]|nr:hypothetical protein [Frankiales bacterium]